MERYFQVDEEDWDQKTLLHEEAPFSDLGGFKKGRDRLRAIELEELGDVSGKAMFPACHCFFGVDEVYPHERESRP